MSLPHLSTSEDVVTHQNPQTIAQDVVTPADTLESKPDLLGIFQDADTTEHIEKYNRYEALYVRRLKAKYFSKKDFNGGLIFDNETTIDNAIIKSSRWPCTRSFADPIQSLDDQTRSPSSAAETSSPPSKKHQPMKSS